MKEHNTNPQSPQSLRSLIVGLVCVGTIMSTLDASIINVAMPTLTAAFKTTLHTSQWFVLSYIVTTTILLLTFGRLGDLLGRHKLYVTGVIVFSLGSLVCGLSVSAIMLILSRAFQAVGASMIMSCGPALVTEASPPQERGKSLGFIGMAVALGLLAGPLVGGVILQYTSWRWMFFINVPIGIALTVLLLTKVHGFDTRRDGRLDIPGAVIMGLALAALTLGLTYGEDLGWTSFPIVAILALAIILGIIFIRVEQRVDSPMLNLALFKNRDFSIGAASGWANYAATMPIAVFMPFYLANTLKYSPEKVGLILGCGPLTLAFVAPIAGRLSDKIGSRFLTATGLFIAGIGILSLQSLTPSSTALDVVWRLVLMSLGSAIFVSPNSSSVMGSVTHNNLGVASGVVALVRNLGMVCGIAIAGAIISSFSRTFSLAGLKAAFLASAILILGGAFISTMRVSPKS